MTFFDVVKKLNPFKK